MQEWHSIGRMMRSWWPSQIKPHQDTYEAVAPLSIERFHSAEDMSFPTIRTDYNGALAPFNRHNAGVAYDDDMICQLVTTPNQASSGHLRGCSTAVK